MIVKSRQNRTALVTELHSRYLFDILRTFLQVFEGVSGGAVPAFPSAQVSTASAFHLLQLALSEPETSSSPQKGRRDLQLLGRRLLLKI